MVKDVFVHSLALCESETIGSGTRIWPFAHVMQGAQVGRRCNVGGGSFIESKAVVGDDCTIKNGVQIWDGVRLGNHVFVGPNATFTNDLRPRSGQVPNTFDLIETEVQSGVTIGANATILCGIKLGANSFVAAGAVVTRDVPAHAMMVGSPARTRGWVCHCGSSLPENLACECGRRYRLQDAQSGLLPEE
jgi:UDP-2-acetamido-3-amino-2,3-dideoxy-glucuronate N-acetyltransferase